LQPLVSQSPSLFFSIVGFGAKPMFEGNLFQIIVVPTCMMENSLSVCSNENNCGAIGFGIYCTTGTFFGI